MLVLKPLMRRYTPSLFSSQSRHQHDSSSSHGNRSNKRSQKNTQGGGGHQFKLKNVSNRMDRVGRKLERQEIGSDDIDGESGWRNKSAPRNESAEEIVQVAKYIDATEVSVDYSALGGDSTNDSVKENLAGSVWDPLQLAR